LDVKLGTKYKGDPEIDTKRLFSQAQGRDSTSRSSAPENDRTFAHLLRDLLVIRNITNKELANLIHTGEGTVSRWVNGKQRPGRRRIAMLEQLLGAKPGTLQSGGSSLRSGSDSERETSAAILASREAEKARLDDSVHETTDRVMLEFNRWLEPYIQNGGYLRAVDAADWMQRMWRASSGFQTDLINNETAASADPEIPLDIDVEPGTGIAITTNKGRLVVVNHALSEMLDLSADQIVGRFVWELNAPQYKEPGRNRIEQQHTEPWDLELMNDSGDRIPVTISNVLCHLRGNPVRVALVKRRYEDQAG
jgi:PAS domain S-box-containing protein